MPFIRQTRDKRGFEQTVVMHAYHRGGGGQGRPRVLYLFRSPANLRVGRQALDAEVMEALEHTHPDLSFDWTSVSREVAPQRQEPERPMRRPPPRPDDRNTRPGPSREPAVAPPDDPSPLGRTVGAAEAAKLRQRYGELVQRIGRRVVAPEDRDRLLERARRLNPDDWQDEGAIRAGQASFDVSWASIASELPSRRRGRRGGRRREGDRAPSAIMNARTEDGEGKHDQSNETSSAAGHGDRDVAGSSGADSAADAAALPDPPADHSIDD